MYSAYVYCIRPFLAREREESEIERESIINIIA